MDVILIRKNRIPSRYTDLIHSILMAGAFVSMFTVATLAYSAYHYTHNKSSAQSATPNPTQEPKSTSSEPLEEELALRLERLQAEAARLNQLGNRLVNSSETHDINFSVSWDNTITKSATTPTKTAKLRPSYNGSFRERFSQHTSIDEVKRSIRIVSEDLLLRQYRTTPTDLPAGWPLRQGRISSKFGWRGRRMHKGIDIAAPTGTPIFAVEDGIVKRARYVRGYGKLVEIQHSEMYSTRYAHNSRNLVETGEYVRKGQMIALVGSTGRSTGPHIHFEVLQTSTAINPIKYLAAMDSFKLSENIKLSEYVKLSQK